MPRGCSRAKRVSRRWQSRSVFKLLDAFRRRWDFGSPFTNSGMLRRRSISSIGRGTTRPCGGCLDTAIFKRRSASIAAWRRCRPPRISENLYASRSNLTPLKHEELRDDGITRDPTSEGQDALAASGSLARGRSQCMERSLPARCAPQTLEVQPAISSRSRAKTMLGTTAAS